MYTVPSSLQDSMNTWIDVPKSNGSLIKTPFSSTQQSKEEEKTMRNIAEEKVGSVCHVLKLGQHCADWFILRQFRVTGTNYGIILMSKSRVRSKLWVQGDVNDRTLG